MWLCQEVSTVTQKRFKTKDAAFLSHILLLTAVVCTSSTAETASREVWVAHLTKTVFWWGSFWDGLLLGASLQGKG